MWGFRVEGLGGLVVRVYLVKLLEVVERNVDDALLPVGDLLKHLHVLELPRFRLILLEKLLEFGCFGGLGVQVLGFGGGAKQLALLRLLDCACVGTPHSLPTTRHTYMHQQRTQHTARSNPSHQPSPLAPLPS